MKVGEPAPKPPKPPEESEITSGWKSGDKKPVVSILCHCFNHEAFIEDALHSFLMQKTDFPWEVIVHDDASTDGSVSIIQEYAEHYPKIIKPIYQKENQYSRGLKPTYFTSKKVQGEFIAFCEGDDYWLDERKLQIQADFLKKNSEYSVCGHDAFIFDEEKILELSKLPDRYKRDVSADALSKGWFILTLTTMFRSKFDLYPEEQSRTHNGDTFLFSRLGKIGGYKYISSISPGAYRVHAGGIWSMVDERQKLAHKVVSMFWISQYYSRVGDLGLSQYYARRSAYAAIEGVKAMSFTQVIAFNFELLKQVVRKRGGWLYALLRNAK